MPENVNFAIKASTVRQFLKTSGLPGVVRVKRLEPVRWVP